MLFAVAAVVAFILASPRLASHAICGMQGLTPALASASAAASTPFQAFLLAVVVVFVFAVIIKA